MPLSIDIDPNSVTHVKGHGYFVASKSTPGAFRLVWGDECSCPATGPSCRHRKLVAAFCAEEDARNRRPVAKVSAGLFVD